MPMMRLSWQGLRPSVVAIAVTAAVLLVPTEGAAHEAAGRVDSTESDETPLLQLHQANAGVDIMKAERKEGIPSHAPPIHPNGLIGKENKTDTPDIPDNLTVHTKVKVKTMTVVIPGNIILGKNVTAMKGNTQTMSMGSLEDLLEQTSRAQSDTLSEAAKKAAEAVHPELPLPRFISTDNTLVWYVDEQAQKHKVVRPSNGACTACGCYYDEDGTPNRHAGYDQLTEEKANVYPTSPEDFTCEKFYPNAMALLDEGKSTVPSGSDTTSGHDSVAGDHSA